MSLIYRAVWDDEWCDPIGVLEDEFRAWCGEKGIDPDDIPHRGPFEPTAALRIDIRRADAEFGKALRCILQELDPRGRTWTTTATALWDAQIRSFWVDVECNDPSGGPAELAAPRLVRRLIENGGRPCLEGTLLHTEATDVASLEGLEELVELLLDPARTFPVVVFSPPPRSTRTSTDPTDGGRVWTRREDIAAQTLAGIAKVFVLGHEVIGKFNAALPPTLHVWGGAVRTYLPIPSLDDPDDGYRHRWIPFREIEPHNRRAATLVAGRLARLRLHPPVPSVWESLSGLLQRPSETEVSARAQQISNSRGFQPAVDDVGSLRREIDDLTKLLAEADLIREEIENKARKEVDRLQLIAKAAEDERYDDANELEQLRRERDSLSKAIWARTQSSRKAMGVGEDLDPIELDVPTDISGAIELARKTLRHVVVPDTALRGIEELESAEKYAVWASAIWQGLLSLETYAQCKGNGEQPPGFKLWCENTGAWPTSKLAMTESDTVLQNPTLRNQRLFQVSRDVEPSGRLVMFSHLKIQMGGGDNIPRLYFYDDTDGPTGQMHVGFIGPHRFVRNTKS